MSKLEDLRSMYDEIELDSTDERELLAKVKNGNASSQEINDLLDIVNDHPQGGQKLEKIKDFEDNLVSEMNDSISDLEEMANEYLKAAHIEDETEKNNIFSDIKKRYKELVNEADETLDALKEAYFQVDDYTSFEERLYNAKEELTVFE